MVPLAHTSQPLKRHLDRVSRFCTVHQCDQQTDTKPLRLTSVATGRIASMHAMRPKTDVTPAILSRDFVAQLYRAIKLRDKIAGVTSV